MKILKGGILCFVLMQIWAMNAMAQTIPYPDFTDCIEDPTKIIYANGVLGNKDESERTTKIIRSVVSKKMTDDLIITYATDASIYGWGYCHDLWSDIQWNPSEGTLLDLYEAWVQLKGDQPSVYIKGFLGVLSWPADFISTVINFGSKTPPPATNSDLFTYANTYQSETHAVPFPSGPPYPWRYVIVSHSQGNFFTNDIYAKYFRGHGPLSSIRLIGAANPDNEVADGGEHVTLTNDKVIELIKDFVTAYNLVNDPDLPLPMVGFTTNLHSDFWNHKFLSAYFAKNSNSETEIVQYIIDQVDTVPFTREDPDDPTAPEIPLEPAGINPTTGEQEACPANDFTFASSGYECTTIFWFGVHHCQPTGPSCNLN